MKIVLATRNPGKLDELRALLRGLPVELVSSGEMPGAPEVEEDGATLEENARKKAVSLASFAGLPALADDTGLEVAALGGAPGVHSARFAGPSASDADNRRKLLAELGNDSDRTARFRTVLAFADGDYVRLFEGTCDGAITTAESGSGGFGYDAIFAPDGDERTFAEMSREDKNEISHRGRALRAFVDYLRERLSD